MARNRRVKGWKQEGFRVRIRKRKELGRESSEIEKVGFRSRKQEDSGEENKRVLKWETGAFRFKKQEGLGVANMSVRDSNKNVSIPTILISCCLILYFPTRQRPALYLIQIVGRPCKQENKNKHFLVQETLLLRVWYRKPCCWECATGNPVVESVLPETLL